MPKVKKSKDREDRIQQAIAFIHRGTSHANAAKLFGIPRSTLQFRLSSSFKKSTCGPAPVLSLEEENILVKWIGNCSRKGFPKTQLDVYASVKEFLDASERPNPFTNNYPGRGWYRAFVKRHPDIVKRKPEAVTSASACVSEKNIRGWFTEIKTVLGEEEATDILMDPNRIFNGDETNFLLCPKKDAVLAIKGSKNVYDVDVGQAKSAITVMFTFSATGKIVPPMLIYPLQRVPSDIVENVPKTWYIGRSENGWMTAETFYEYIGNAFCTFLAINHIKLPVILFVDGHKTHLTQHVSKLCSELQIILIALYPNATRILQPADVAAFRPIKDGWKREVLEWRRKHPHGTLTKKEVAPLLESVLQKKDLTMILKNGFRATGLHPWNPYAINFSKCLGRSSTQEITGDAKNLHYEKAVQTEASLQKPSFKFDKFCELVGEERLEIYKTRYLNRGEAEMEAENILYRIWREFQSSLPVPDMRESETSLPDQQDILHVPSSLSLSEHLQWPETPKRKGRRQTDRVPFVVSSLRWQEIAAEKTAKKQAEISAREERKKAREQKKKEKEQENAKKNKRVSTYRASTQRVTP